MKCFIRSVLDSVRGENDNILISHTGLNISLAFYVLESCVKKCFYFNRVIFDIPIYSNVVLRLILYQTRDFFTINTHGRFNAVRIDLKYPIISIYWKKVFFFFFFVPI